MARLLIFLCFLSVSNYIYAINVSFHTSVFYTGAQPYMDVGFRILSGGLTFIPDGQKKMSASVAVTMTVLDSTNTYVVAWEKYKLLADQLDAPRDLIDQRRFLLSPGVYHLKLLIEDDNQNANSFGLERIIRVEPLKKPMFSSLNLITSVGKKEKGPFVYNGIYMEPFAFDLVNETQQLLHFYTEYYPDENAPKDTASQAIFRFSVHHGFEPADGDQPALVRYKKINLDKVVPVSGFFDLNKIISGNYHLQVAHVDEKKNIISRKYYPFINRNFPADVANARNYNTEVSNSFVGKLDSARLYYSLKSLSSQIPTDEASSLAYALSDDANIEVRKFFLFKYWKDRYPTQPEAAYNGYMKVVEALDNQFYNAFRKGHETDRGYIFLKYGKPNKVISIDDEANTPPYEIWYYDFMPKTNQNNVRFIFYCPMLANEYELLHSTCRGERSNKQWEIQLYKNSKNEAINPGIDATEMNRNWNRKARKLFEDQ